MPPAKTARAKPATPRQSKLNFGPPKPGAKTSASKQKLPPNGNILNFFKKVDVEEPLFIGDPSVGGAAAASSPPRPKLDEPAVDGIHHLAPEVGPSSESRFNEDVGSLKRRKLDCDGDENDAPATTNTDGATSTSQKRVKRTKAKKGPFLDDSDSESESAVESPTKEETPADSPGMTRLEEDTAPQIPPRSALLRDESCAVVPDAPRIKTEDSVYDDFNDMDEMEALFDDELDDGEEYRAMRYMQEQARLEAEDAMDPPPDEEI
ncbi:hypothetical protein PG991_004155 [Apiospora marii]|uniref:Uncharacterized protein n=1 Tax=Apiospora marii TaxID=335849 RepID=A0ABR1S5J8_9PEZI